MTKKDAQMLIFRARSWKKKMSWIKIRPVTWVTVPKQPLRIRAAMKESKVLAPAHQAAVAVETTRNQKVTGRRPIYAAKMTARRLERSKKGSHATVSKGTRKHTENTAGTKHEHVAGLAVVNLVRCHIPFGSLGKKRDGTRGTAIVWQKRGARDNE